MNKPIFHSTFDTAKLRRLYPKHIHSLSIYVNSNNDSNKIYRNAKILKKCKILLHLNLNNHSGVNTHSLFRQIIKSHKRSIQKLSPHHIESSFARHVPNLKSYEFYVNELSDWKNIYYLPGLRILKMLDSGIFDCSNDPFSEIYSFALFKAQTRASFRRYVKFNNKLETLVYRGSLNREIVECFQLVETYIDSLKNLENINLMVFSFGTKILLVSEDLPKFFSRIKSLRVIKSSGNYLAENILRAPEALAKVSRIMIDIANCSEKNLSFLRKLASLGTLKSLHIMIHNSGRSMFEHFLSELVLPESLCEFTLHMHNLRLADLVQHAHGRQDVAGNPFEAIEGFRGFLSHLQNAKELKTLELKLFSNEFKAYYTEFFNSIISCFGLLETLRIRIIEPSYNIQQQNLPEPFLLDSFLKKQARLLSQLKGLTIVAPTISLSQLPSNLKEMSNLRDFNCGNKVDYPKGSKIISELFAKMTSKEKLSVGFGKESIDDLDYLKERLKSFISIPSIDHVGYAFKSSLGEKIVLKSIRQYAMHIPRASLKFSLISDDSEPQEREELTRLIERSGRTCTMYDRGSERYIFWGTQTNRP